MIIWQYVIPGEDVNGVVMIAQIAIFIKEISKETLILMKQILQQPKYRKRINYVLKVLLKTKNKNPKFDF